MDKNSDRLKSCPDSPNCVSTASKLKKQFIAPYSCLIGSEKGAALLKSIVGKIAGAKLVFEEKSYLHYEFKTRIFGFIDDVEFVFDDDAKLVHFRSASRLGYSDLGTNRRRMETIRTLLNGLLG